MYFKNYFKKCRIFYFINGCQFYNLRKGQIWMVCFLVVKMNKKEAIAYAQVALHTLQTSANKDNITPAELGMEMRTIFRMHDRQEVMIRATKLLEKSGDANGK